MAEFFGCDKTTILNYAKSIGYVNNYLPYLTEAEKQDIIDKYHINTAKELGLKYGVSCSLITKIWSEAEKKGKINYTYHFDPNYFEDINSYDKAYFLGLLAADENIFIPKNKKRQGIIRITLQEQDKNILETFKKYISCNKPLHICKKEVKGQTHYYYELEIVSNKMVADLKKYNIVPRKTYNFIMPKLQNDLISHFIRGYFDGDGSITVKRNTDHLPYVYNISISGFKNNLEII